MKNMNLFKGKYMCSKRGNCYVLTKKTFLASDKIAILAIVYFIFQKEVNKVDSCSVGGVGKSNNIYSVVDNSTYDRIMHKVNRKNMDCSCCKITRYGIPCCHILFIYEFVGEDLLDLIISTTSKRWLLPEYAELSKEEIKKIWISPDLKRNQNEANGSNIKLKKFNN
ncbi:unnamed protein product [Blepharisma stoltei]|uniref:SWIM-type domain-containing protein n=1 Tax=Blepharisma stoltei TaxID=1481888 RepID=A0AAU9K3M0_9CILI|nr:unnamed protein product [Blepharisma stoltei]